MDPYLKLSRRERQIIAILHRRGQATAAEVQAELPDPPGYSAVRSALTLLVDREVIRREEDGLRYVYSPVLSKEGARRSALRDLLHTFFGGSRKQVMATLLSDEELRLTDSEYREMRKLLDSARERGKT